MGLKIGDKVMFSDQSWCPLGYLLAGKAYEVVGLRADIDLLFYVMDESGHKLLCLYSQEEGCGHLNRNQWTKVEAGTVKEPIFQLTSKHVLYFNGKAEILNIGDCFQLAGLKLSSMGNESPFHYKGEIVRLPNSILKEIE